VRHGRRELSDSMSEIVNDKQFMKRLGKHPKLETVEDYRKAVKAYHTLCEQERDGEGIFPDLAGLRLYLGKSKGELKLLMDGDGDFAMGLRDVFDEAQDMRESWLARKMCSDNRRAIGCMNALKQQENGGYTDKPVDSSEKTLTINVSGIKGGAKAFK